MVTFTVSLKVFVVPAGFSRMIIIPAAVIIITWLAPHIMRACIVYRTRLIVAVPYDHWSRRMIVIGFINYILRCGPAYIDRKMHAGLCFCFGYRCQSGYQ